MSSELSNLICTLRPDGREVDYLRYGSGHLHGMLLDKERLIDVERDNNHREIARHWAQTMLQTTIYDEADPVSISITQTLTPIVYCINNVVSKLIKSSRK
nr:hypothetical protein [Oligella urethralis]